jgi:hypothetical protein
MKLMSLVLLSVAGYGIYKLLTPSETAYLQGDVNGDGAVNQADIDIVMRIIMGYEYPADVVERADVNKNGVVDMGDVVAIERIMHGLPVGYSPSSWVSGVVVPYAPTNWAQNI